MREILNVLAALGDPVRLRLLRLLRGRELCVCELVDALRMPQYKISRHLRSLRAVGLVKARRDGRWMHYRLSRRGAHARLIRELLDVVCRRVDKTRLGKQDDSNLRVRLAVGKASRCLARPAA